MMSPAVEFRHVTKSFGARRVLDDVSFRVDANAALFDSITVGENVGFPMRRHTRRSDAEIRARARDLLAQVGLADDFEKMPAELSGGMRKRAGLAAEIDGLFGELRARSQTTLLVVTHNVPSAKAIGDELIFLHQGHVIARGSPTVMAASDIPLVRQFMASEGSG